MFQICLAILIAVIAVLFGVFLHAIFDDLSNRIDRLEIKVNRSNEILAFFFEVLSDDLDQLQTKDADTAFISAYNAVKKTEEHSCLFMPPKIEELVQQQAKEGQRARQDI